MAPSSSPSPPPSSSSISNATALELPGFGYRVRSWKVKFGSAVRRGETVAVAVAADPLTSPSEGGDDNSNSNRGDNDASSSNEQDRQEAAVDLSQPPQHKRPQRRPTRHNSASATSKSAAAPIAAADKPKPKGLLSSLTAGVRSTGAILDKTSLNIADKKVVAAAAAAAAAATADDDDDSKPDNAPGADKDSGTRSAAEVTGTTKHAPSSSSSSSLSSKGEKPSKHNKEVLIKANADGILTKPEDVNGQSSNDDSNILAYIVPCRHPAVLDGMCVVCGLLSREMDKSKDTMAQPSSSPFSNTSSLWADNPGAAAAPDAKDSKSQVTVSGGMTMTVSKSERRDMSYQVQQRLWKQRKLNLVLDLDHTLVHATPDRRAHEYYLGNSKTRDTDDDGVNPTCKKRSDVYALSLLIPDEVVSKNVAVPKLSYHFVKLRPNVATFLKELQPLYEISVYTAGTRDYANEIVQMLCRHTVGANHDGPILAELRTQASNAAIMYAAAQKRNDRKRTMDKANAENKDDNSDSQPPSKKHRKKVGFAETVTTSNDNESASLKDDQSNSRHDNKKMEQTVSAAKSPQMTLEELTAIQTKLKQAEEIEAEAVELRKRLFGSRIISRTDVGDLGRDVKSLERVFPGGGSMAAVVDDREDVWANASDNANADGEPPHNLLLVRPYHFTPFAGFAEVNNPSGADPSKLTTADDDDENDSETDQQLLWTIDTLKDLHRLYYLPRSRANRDTVPEILIKMRRSVLRGCNIVLSGIVPLHLQQRHRQQDDNDNEDATRLRKRAPMVRYLETLGAAMVETVVAGRTTHVVAANAGTAKAQAARNSSTATAPPIALVKPSWLMECYWSVSKRSVKRHVFDVNDYRPEMDDGRTSGDDSDSEEDGFASELERAFL